MIIPLKLSGMYHVHHFVRSGQGLAERLLHSNQRETVNSHYAYAVDFIIQ